MNRSNSVKKSLIISLAISFVFIISILPYAPARAEAALNLVQVQILPSDSNTTQFYVAVYNSSGILVAQASGAYPLFSFGLPQGKYLITATATGSSKPVPVPLLYAQGSPLQPVNNSSSTAIAMPIIPIYQEYGYTLVSINSSTNLTIATKEASKIAVYSITISVKFPDGSPVSGAEVYANPVLPVTYYWWLGVNQSEVKMWGETDSSGQVQLKVPELPMQVTAWVWIPIKPPQQHGNIITTIGGEPINVSISYQPTSVGFTGSALVIPPQNTATIVLHYQPQNYFIYNSVTPPVPASLSGIAQSSGQLSGAIPANLYQSIQATQPVSSIPSFDSSATSQPANSLSYAWLIAVIGALILAVAGSLLVMRKAK